MIAEILAGDPSSGFTGVDGVIGTMKILEMTSWIRLGNIPIVLLNIEGLGSIIKWLDEANIYWNLETGIFSLLARVSRAQSRLCTTFRALYCSYSRRLSSQE